MSRLLKSLHKQKVVKWAALVIVLAAFGLRMWQLESVPPGWRDDELINSLVISQHALDGEIAVYYADASGHEALYHLLNAVMLGLFGPNIIGIRLLSVFLGTLTAVLTYQVGRYLFSQRVGLIAAAGLAFSFWSLMYSRIGLRHILTPLLMLLTILFFWQGLMDKKPRLQKRENVSSFLSSPSLSFFLAGLFMALGMYTYFASRGVPLIVAAFCGFLFVVDRARFKRHWVGLGVMFGITAVLSLPLFITLNRQPESEARVAELAVPIVEARQGNFEPLVDYTEITLSMFHRTGDDEWLYNIPGRPIFGQVGALIFWSGVLIALWQTARSVWRPKPKYEKRPLAPALPFAFLLIWWLAGISPGFISIPPASLGHTILAQPATFILAALPFEFLMNRNRSLPVTSIMFVGALLFLGSIAVRDWPDYFGNWPQRGMVRFLYRGDFHDIANYLDAAPHLTDVGVTGLLAGPWDKLALSIDMHQPVRVRWYNPQRVVLVKPAVSFAGFPEASDSLAAAWEPLPVDVAFGDYQLVQVEAAVQKNERHCFQNGLCVISALFDPKREELNLVWEVARPLTLPEIPLISNPPPPNVYAGPRLSVFAHLLDVDDTLIVGDDGLWVDPTTLQSGDVFIQQHRLVSSAAEVGTAVSFGLYDPMTGERILTDEGTDQVRIEFE